MFENRRRGRQARNFTTNAPKILDLKSSSEQIFSRKLPLGAPGLSFLSRTFADGQFNCPCIELTKNWEQQLNLLVRQTLIRDLPQVASRKTPKFCQSKPYG